MTTAQDAKTTAQNAKTTAQNELANARYVSIATYRRSGAAVETPVWAAEADGVFYIFSAGNAGKVKRLRMSPRARLATCDARGGSLGEWREAHAELIDTESEIAIALSALRQKYGVQMWIADVGARLTGRYHKRAYIKAHLTD